MDDLKNKVELIFNEIGALLEVGQQNLAKERELTELDFKLRDREKIVDTKLTSITKAKDDLQKEKDYIEKRSVEVSKIEDNNKTVEQSLNDRKLKLDEREAELKGYEAQILEKVKQMGDLGAKERELREREDMIRKETIVERERKELLTAKEKQLREKEDRLQRIAQG